MEKVKNILKYPHLLVRDTRPVPLLTPGDTRLCRAGPGHGVTVTKPGYHIRLSQFCQHHRRLSA
jgi:hypothetical protein